MVEELHCSNFEDRAILYAAGELIEEDGATVEVHAQQCPSCAAVLAREISLRKALAARVQPAHTLDHSELLLARCRSELFEALVSNAMAVGGRLSPRICISSWLECRHADPRGSPCR